MQQAFFPDYAGVRSRLSFSQSISQSVPLHIILSAKQAGQAGSAGQSTSMISRSTCDCQTSLGLNEGAETSVSAVLPPRLFLSSCRVQPPYVIHIVDKASKPTCRNPFSPSRPTGPTAVSCVSMHRPSCTTDLLYHSTRTTRPCSI